MIVNPQRRRGEAQVEDYTSNRQTQAASPDVLAYDRVRGGGVLRRWKWILLLLLLVAVMAAAAPLNRWRSQFRTSDADLIYYTVQRGDLPITVTERGNLESQQNIEIICEVDDVANDGINGTQIVWIIPNGSSVKEGELLVELDSAPHKERLDQQILETDRARANQIQAQAKHENQISQNETSRADAQLDVELAELELEMFSDEQSGTRKLKIEEIERLIEDVNNEIRASQANLKLKENEKRGIETLFKLGYAGKSELDRSRLDFLQAEGQYAAKLNRLKTQLATLRKLQDYELDMEYLQLQGKLETSRRSLEQVKRNNEALLAQSQAVLDAANQALEKEQERLERYQEQLAKCKIYAPQDGMVAYAVSQSRYYREEIREGAAVRPRQQLLSLPNLTKMQVKTAVHESVLDQIRQGLPATVRVDAFADRVYHGSVKSVAVLPDPGGYLSSDTKVYETVVTVDEDVQQLKPGMTAVVEIHVDRLKNVISLPVQAVVQIQKETWCYVDEQGKPIRRSLKLGRSNDKFVEIVEGLNAGERVVLNPMAILDETQRSETEPENEMSDVEGETLPAPPEMERPASEDRQSPATENEANGRGSNNGQDRPRRKESPRKESPQGEASEGT